MRSDRHTDKWNRTENPEIDSYKYAQLMFTKVQKQFNGEKTGFSTNGAVEKLNTHTYKKTETKTEISHLIQKLTPNE